MSSRGRTESESEALPSSEAVRDTGGRKGRNAREARLLLHPQGKMHVSGCTYIKKPSFPGKKAFSEG